MYTLPLLRDAAFPLTFERRQWCYTLDGQTLVHHEALCYLENCGFDALESFTYLNSLRRDYEKAYPRRNKHVSVLSP